MGILYISFFEVPEAEAERVLQGLAKAQVKGRRITVEIATGEAHESGDGKKARRAGRDGRKGRDERGARDRRKHDNGYAYEEAAYGKSKGTKGKEAAGKKRAERAEKPSREERGYTAARGKKYTKDDWKQFFEPKGADGLVGEEPDFSEEGWARRIPKK